MKKPFYTLTPDEMQALQWLLEYVYPQEEKDFEDMELDGEDTSDHVFNSIVKLDEAVARELV